MTTTQTSEKSPEEHEAYAAALREALKEPNAFDFLLEPDYFDNLLKGD